MCSDLGHSRKFSSRACPSCERLWMLRREGGHATGQHGHVCPDGVWHQGLTATGAA
jgi:hypothetical protein